MNPCRVMVAGGLCPPLSNHHSGTDSVAAQEQPEQQPGMRWGDASTQLMQAMPGPLGWAATDVGRQAAKNTPASAARLAGDMAAAVSSPVQTAQALHNTSVGIMQKPFQTIGGQTGTRMPSMPGPLGGLASYAISSNEDYTPYADALGQQYMDRYGGVDNIKNTLSNDPVGAAADVLGILNPAGTAGNTAKGGSAAAKARRLVNQNKLEAFKQAGIKPPSLGAVSDSRFVQALEGGLDQNIFAANRMREAFRRGQEGLTTAIDDAAARLAGGNSIPADLETMGAAARMGAENAKNAFSKKAQAFEENVYRPLDSQNMRLENTLGIIDEKASKLSPAMGESYMQRINQTMAPTLADAAEGSMNVYSGRELARQFGEQLKPTATASTQGAQQFELKRLYGAIKQDINAAVPEAFKGQVKNYNKWYSSRKNLADHVDKRFFGNKKESAVARAILTADGGDLEKLQRLVGPKTLKHYRLPPCSKLPRAAARGAARGLHRPRIPQRRLAKGAEECPSGRGMFFLEVSRTI